MAVTVELGLVGAGISGSFSPALHEVEAQRLGLKPELHYRLIDLDALGLGTEDIGEIIRATQLLGFSGLNITHPVKQAVIPHLDALSREAEIIGAVNTVVFADGHAVGHNTDWYGFAELDKLALAGEKNDRVVQLGAGGAGSAVAFAQLRLGVERLELLDVDFERAEALAASLTIQFGEGRVIARPMDSLADAVGAADGIVNATPLGMDAYPGSPVPPDLLTASLWVLDVVYRPIETQFIRDARANGARATGGAAMTVFQAAEAFRLFTGHTPDASRMLAHVHELIAAEQ